MFHRPYLSIFLVLVSILTAAAGYQGKQQYTSSLKELAYQAEMIGELAYPWVSNPTTVDFQTILGKLAIHSSPAYLIVINSDMRVIFSYPRTSMIGGILPSQWATLGKRQQVLRHFNDDTVVETIFPIISGNPDNSIEFGDVILGVSERQILKPIQTTILLFGSIGFIAVLGCLFLFYAINRNFEQAFVSFRDQISGIALGTIVPLNSRKVDPKSWQNLMKDMNQILQGFDETKRQLVETQRSAAMVELASQVAHDIRSPLTALGVATEELHDLPEDKRSMIQGAVGRINDIANHLLMRSRPVGAGNSKVGLVQTTIDSLVTEKRIQYRGRPHVTIRVTPRGNIFGVFCSVPEQDLMRVLSNLIDNGYEAITHEGWIHIQWESNPHEILLTIEDNGSGISSEILNRIGNKGESFGKTGGSGLGIYTAKSILKSHGGSFEIISTVGVGTRVTMKLPRVSAPPWFASEVALPESAAVVILDDDESIHQVWKQRLSAHGASSPAMRVFHFYRFEELDHWLQGEGKILRPRVFLVDYEVTGSGDTGLDFILKHRLTQEAFLVTSHFGEDEVQHRCLEAGIKMLPKGLAPTVPILS